MPTTKELRAEGRERKIARRRAHWLYLWNAREHLAAKRYEAIKRWRARHPERSALVDQVQKVNQRAGYRGDKNRISVADWTFLRDMRGGECFRCREMVDLNVDHVVPTSHGGLNHPSNLQPLCKSCNSIKSTDCTDYRTEAERDVIAARFGSPKLRKTSKRS